MSRRRRKPIAAGCRAAIRSFTPRHSPLRDNFAAGLRALCRRPVRCMASAAATWCWAKAWKTRPAGTMPMTGLLGHCDELRQAQAASRLSHRAASVGERAGRRRHASSAAMNSTTRRCMSAGGDDPFAEIADGEGRPLESRRPARPRHRHVLSCDCGRGGISRWNGYWLPVILRCAPTARLEG